MPTSDCDVLIVGAGLAGLSAAYHLKRRSYRLIERETSAGGLCRSVREGGFTFDHTGHLLHMRRPEIRSLVFSLIGEQALLRVERRAGVYSHSTYTDYPFQVNTHGLPQPVVRDCVTGFAETLQTRGSVDVDPSFREWIVATFGHGFARHFLLPYNTKLFCADLETMTADWVSWSIPKPSWEDVVRGALGINRKIFGYNPQFYYPAAAGIDRLPQAFLRRICAPEFSTALVSINAARRQATLSSGERIRFRTMITTTPLPRLLEQTEGIPRELGEGGRQLRHVSVLNLNLGFDAPCLQPYHWIYFPEPAYPFYRVGAYSNLCPASVPAAHSAYYVEISHRPTERLDVGRLAKQCAAALREVGLIPPTANLSRVCAIEIPCAYVIHDRARRDLLPEALAYLERHEIFSIGRYGAWEYSAMEDALWQGRLAAERASAGATDPAR